MRPILIALAVLLLAAPSASAATREVEVGDFFFGSSYVSADVGDTVDWKLAPRSNSHTVTGARFDSKILVAGQSFSQTFTEPGQYQYLCELHSDGMRGVVQVGADRTRPRLSRVRARRSDRSVRVGFGLSEWSRTSVIVRRNGKRVGSKTSKLMRDDGRRGLSVKVGALRAGRYRVAVVARDPAGNRSKTGFARLRVR